MSADIEICSACERTRRTGSVLGKCLNPKANIYGNCFNRIECYELHDAPADRVIEKVLDSNAFAFFTREQEVVLRERLMGIMNALRARESEADNGK